MREIYPREAAKYYEDDLQVITTGTSRLGIVEKLRSFEGLERWIQTDKVPVRDQEGKVTGIIVMSQNITERKRIEARFRLLVDSNVQGVIFWNKKGEISGANDAFLHLVDYTREDLEAGRINWRALTPPEYAHLDRSALEQMTARGVCTPYEKEFIRRDGSRTPILLGAATFANNANEGVCFVLDLTERKRAEEINIEQAALLDKTRDAIVVRDLDGKVLFWNKGAEGMYGWSSPNALGRKTSDFLYSHPEQFEKFNDLTVKRGEWNGEIQHLTRAGDKITVEARWTLIRGQGRSSSKDSETTNILDTIQSSAKRGADVVRQVLSFARGLESAQIEVQPKHLLEEVENIVRETFPKNIQLQFLIPKDSWTIEGDPTQIHQILLNLCVNARDAMANGGNLTVSVENCVLDEHYSAMNLQPWRGVMS